MLITPKGGRQNKKSRLRLAAAFQGKLVMGGPRHVLAGTYSREALVYFGWLETFFYRTVWTVDVRSALNFVERGEAAAGTAYAMDARLSEKVKTAALVSGACGRAREILNFFPPPPRQD